MRMDPPTDAFVYLMEAENGSIKIGISSRPECRAEQVLHHSPVPVRLIAKWRGGRGEEQVLHHRFRLHRLHKEWFRCEGELAQFVAAKRGVGLSAPIVSFEVLSHEARMSAGQSVSEKISRKLRALWSDPEWRSKRAAAAGRNS